MKTIPSLTLDDARRIAAAAMDCAARMDSIAAVAVVDPGGNPIVLLRGDGATFMSTGVALRKAVSAAGFGAGTAEMNEMLAGMPSMLTPLASQPGTALLPGGVPLTADGVLVGAVGVSASSPTADVPSAVAGADALQRVPA